MSKSDDFPYTPKQQRWWFATHGAQQSRITPTEPTPAQGMRLARLIHKKEADIRAQRGPYAQPEPVPGQLTYGWDAMELRGKDWSVRDSRGVLVKKFADPNQARAYAEKHSRVGNIANSMQSARKKGR